ncbi:Lycopene cyclase protein [Rubripirellula obstinata]|uniref:Lycopene cyclase protein n=1 Tax=Rubripirellula obstinata TaxID=406547 RepID=A0A5B1CDL7_9BACT|nr:lycopene beta-cyclase CrtY [Rubripirellula obstinata]KAA1258686.1 Lycopene cyclase protein [Rubripirellula obstinata]
MPLNANHFDTILVGGGLQSGLIAMALRHADPNHSILLIERDSTIGGNHTWSFHLSDVEEHFLAAIDSLIETTWNQYSVRVGRTRRTLRLPYASISSTHFATVIAGILDTTSQSKLLTGCVARDVDGSSVQLEDGRTFTADLVIDSRGPGAQRVDAKANQDSQNFYQGGYQKFWGFEFELNSDWPDMNPIIMDDRTGQEDGFRFFYVLPFDRRRVMIEDTRFSNTTELNRDECLGRVEAYLETRGIAAGRIIREEHGVLPMPIDHQHRPSVNPNPSRPILGGYAGGWFHAATGYSFPLAAAVAMTIAETSTSSNRRLATGQSLEKLAEDYSFQATFGRFLNRLMFELVRPESRYQIFQRFYRVLGEQQISRFYSHRFRRSDAARIVIGMPPTGLRPIRFARSFRSGGSTKVHQTVGGQSTTGSGNSKGHFRKASA